MLVGSWLPLFAVGILFVDSNPIGLALFAWAGSLLGLVVTVIGLFAASIRYLRTH